MSGNNGSRARVSKNGSARLPHDLGLHYTGLCRSYRWAQGGASRVPAAHRVRAPQGLPGIPRTSSCARFGAESGSRPASLRGRRGGRGAPRSILDLRQNPSVLAREPDQRLSLLLDELLHARTDEELLVGLYEIVKPALLEAEREYARTTQQIVDYPTVRLLRPIIADLEEHCLVSAPCASWSTSAVGAARSPSLQIGCVAIWLRPASAVRSWGRQQRRPALAFARGDLAPTEAIRDERMPAETSSFASAPGGSGRTGATCAAAWCT